MPVRRKRKNRGKGVGAKERRRRIAQHNDAVREAVRARYGNIDPLLVSWFTRRLK